MQKFKIIRRLTPGVYTFTSVLLISALWPSSHSQPPPSSPVLALNGNSDFMSVPSSASLSPGLSVTVEAWVKPDSLPVDEIAIAAKWRDIGAVNRSYLLWIFRSRFELLISHDGRDFPRVTSTTPVPVGVWTHVAGTYDGTTSRLYVNAGLEASRDTSGALAVTQEPFFVGRADAGANVSDFFPGQIDEVRVWSIARTQPQISSAMNDTLAPAVYTNPNSGLAGYWRFDQLEDLGINQDGADDIRDLTANNNHGDLTGGSLITTITDNRQLIPGDFVLHPNYPNPFNPSTRISYTLSRATNVELTIYNLQGQQLKTLVDDFQTVGDKFITWDGRDVVHKPVAAGLYFARLKTDRSFKYIKMTLIK